MALVVILLSVAVMVVGTWSPRAPRSSSDVALTSWPLRLAALAGCVGTAVALGGVAVHGSGLAVSPLSTFAELGGPWAFVAFIGGRVVAGATTSGLVGCGLTTIAMLSYVAYLPMYYDEAGAADGFLVFGGGFWLLAASSFGLVFGLCGWLSRGRRPTSRAVGFAVLVAFLVAEAGYDLPQAAGVGPTAPLVVEIAVAAAIAWLGVRSSSTRAFSISVALTLGVTVLLAMLALAAFPLLGAA